MNQQNHSLFSPGPILLFGSGETSASGRKAFEYGFKHAARKLPAGQNLRVAILETPAGYELNSAQVAGRVGAYLREHLQNYNPQTTLVPARKRGTAFSPDNPEVLSPILEADVLFMGPGSPTYAVRQLKDSLAWQWLVARQRMGAVLALASAATVAISRQALPVYEIYKVGEDIHWKAGLDFFRPYGLRLVCMPHWNNTDGGEELDTSRCFMGRERFDPLMAMLPADTCVVGLDEKTILAIDPTERRGHVMGLGQVTVLRQGKETCYKSGQSFDLHALGDFHLPDPLDGLSEAVWEQVAQARQAAQKRDAGEDVRPPAAVQALMEQRQAARQQKDWGQADRLRQEIAAQGWQVEDTRDGPRLTRIVDE